MSPLTAPRTHRQVRRLQDLGHHEGRQGFEHPFPFRSHSHSPWERTDCIQEFAGTLLGFDDYVSKYTIYLPNLSIYQDTVERKYRCWRALRHGPRGRDWIV